MTWSWCCGFHGGEKDEGPCTVLPEIENFFSLAQHWHCTMKSNGSWSWLTNLVNNWLTSAQVVRRGHLSAEGQTVNLQCASIMNDCISMLCHVSIGSHDMTARLCPVVVQLLCFLEFWMFWAQHPVVFLPAAVHPCSEPSRTCTVQETSALLIEKLFALVTLLARKNFPNVTARASEYHLVCAYTFSTSLDGLCGSTCHLEICSSVLHTGDRKWNWSQDAPCRLPLGFMYIVCNVTVEHNRNGTDLYKWWWGARP